MPEEKKQNQGLAKPKKSLLEVFDERKDQSKLIANVFSGFRDKDLSINGEMINGKKRTL